MAENNDETISNQDIDNFEESSHSPDEKFNDLMIKYTLAKSKIEQMEKTINAANEEIKKLKVKLTVQEWKIVALVGARREDSKKLSERDAQIAEIKSIVDAVAEELMDNE